MSAAEAGDARQLLIFLDQGCSLAVYFLDGDFNRNLPPGAAAGFSGAHICLSGFDRSNRSILGLDRRRTALAVNLSVKTRGEKRQTVQARNQGDKRNRGGGLACRTPFAKAAKKTVTRADIALSAYNDSNARLAGSTESRSDRLHPLSAAGGISRRESRARSAVPTSIGNIGESPFQASAIPTRVSWCSASHPGPTAQTAPAALLPAMPPANSCIRSCMRPDFPISPTPPTR